MKDIKITEKNEIDNNIDKVKKMKPDSQSRNYLLTINNPIDKGWTHEKIIQTLNTIASLKYYCISDEIGGETETYHSHIFCMFDSPKLFSTIKNKFSDAHIDISKGNKFSNRMYVLKEGKWEKSEKSTTKVPGTQVEWGNIGEYKRIADKEHYILEEIQSYIDDGLTPNEIFLKGVQYIKYQNIVKKAYFLKRYEETDVERELTFYYHIGDAGSGKSYEYVKLCRQYGRDHVYKVTDYANGGNSAFDNYFGQEILFMDEYKNSLYYGQLLMLTDKYICDIHSRYVNCYGLYHTIHIASIFPCEELYKNMVAESDRGRDSIQQLLRRITYVVYHEKAGDKYFRFQLPMCEYKNALQIKNLAHIHWLKTDEEYKKQIELSNKKSITTTITNKDLDEMFGITSEN